MSAKMNLKDEQDKITIIGRNLSLSDAIKKHIYGKLQKLDELTPSVISVVVILELNRELSSVEILYKFSHFKIVTHGVMDDMYMAIDLACSRLRRKLIKWKDMIKSHSDRKFSDVDLGVQVLDVQTEELYDINDAIEEESEQEIEDQLKPPKVVKHKVKKMSILTTDEAAMRMDLSRDRFMVYRGEEDQKIKVIYIRRDNTLGILDVE